MPAIFAGVMIASPAFAQMSESDLVTRLNRLEAQVRQLTGQNEQLQYRNQQLEQQLSRAQAGGPPPRTAAAPQAQPQYAPPPQAYPPPQQQAYPQPQQAYPAAQQGYPPPQQQSYPVQQSAMEREPYSPPPPPAGLRRGDAFDPAQNPNAAGAPRALGAPATFIPTPPPERADVGAPGGREAGAPLDLGTMSEDAANEPPPRSGPVRQIPGALPAPPPRNPSGTGAQQMAMAPVAATPKEEYEHAYAHVLHKDYALAEEGLRAFLQKYPKDRLTADANYWLGESLFQRQRYREAAESFLTVSTKYETAGKAPDSLLRLGQSLAALKEKEAACATLAEVPRKYPRAAANIKTSAEREQKRVGCI